MTEQNSVGVFACLAGKGIQVFRTERLRPQKIQLNISFTPSRIVISPNGLFAIAVAGFTGVGSSAQILESFPREFQVFRIDQGHKLYGGTISNEVSEAQVDDDGGVVVIDGKASVTKCSGNGSCNIIEVPKNRLSYTHYPKYILDNIVQSKKSESRSMQVKQAFAVASSHIPSLGIVGYPSRTADDRFLFARQLSADGKTTSGNLFAIDAKTGKILENFPGEASSYATSLVSDEVAYTNGPHIQLFDLVSAQTRTVNAQLQEGSKWGFVEGSGSLFVESHQKRTIDFYNVIDLSKVEFSTLIPNGFLSAKPTMMHGSSMMALVNADEKSDGIADTLPVRIETFQVDKNPQAKEEISLETTNYRPYDLSYTLDNHYFKSTIPTLQLWGASSGALVVTAASFSSGEWVVITPEGFFDASPHGAQYLNLVRGLKATSLGQAYQALYRPDLVRAKLAGDPDGKVKAAAAKLDLNKVVDSGPEPQVRFAAGDADVSSRTQDVAVSLADRGGGIGKVEWRVNGVTQGIDEGNVARSTALDEDGDAKPSGKTVDLHRTLQLEPGANRIEVVAYNAAGLIASDPVGVTLTRKANEVAAEPQAATAPRLFVLAVGVNDYFDGRLRLAYAVPDAKALAEGFRKAGQGLYSDVSVTTLLDADVTRAKLDATFAELGTKMKPTDVFVFFIAGHGKTVDGHYHFIPYDFRYLNAQSILTEGIDQDRFQAWLARIPARKSLMLTDTCESGSLTEDPMRVASRGLETVEAQNAAIELLTRAVGRTVLSASTDDAPALEGYRGHGVFSYAVLDALAHAEAGGDGFITVTSLAGFVDRKVQDVSYAAFHIRQIPQMKVVGSNFPVAHRLDTALVGDDQAAPGSAASPDQASAIPTRPTHVVIAPVTVRATADAAGTAVTDLPPGAQVTLVQTKDGWTVVAREGKKLGYVKADALIRLQ